MAFLESLQASPIADWVRNSDYGYYITLSGHAIGMGVVAGTMFMLTARTLGFARHSPVMIFDRLFTIAWLGFILNAITGVMLFMSNGEHLMRNVAFLTKLSLIAVGGVAAWLLWRTLMAEREAFEATGQGSAKAKTVAVITFLLWAGAIVAGRIIGYTIKYY